LSLIEELGLTEYGIKVFQDIDSKKQRETTTTQETTRMLLSCDEILVEKKNFSSIIPLHNQCFCREEELLCRQNPVLDFLRSSSWTRASPTGLLIIGDDEPNTPRTV